MRCLPPAEKPNNVTVFKLGKYAGSLNRLISRLNTSYECKDGADLQVAILFINKLLKALDIELMELMLLAVLLHGSAKCPSFQPSLLQTGYPQVIPSFTLTV